jgi:anti-anti-sigma factor
MTDDVLQGRRERVRVAHLDTASRDQSVPGQLEIQRGVDEDEVVLALLGELDLGSAPELERELREIEATKPRRILIDLRSLDFIDCAGIALIAQAQRSAHAAGHRLALRSGPGQVRRLFQLTGLVERFTFLDEPGA